MASERVPDPPDPIRFGLTRERAQILQAAPREINFTPLVIVIAAIGAFTAAFLVPDKNTAFIAAIFSFGLLNLIGNALAESINKKVIGFKNWKRSQQPDYSKFLGFQAAVNQHDQTLSAIREREVARQKERERLVKVKEDWWAGLDGMTFEVELRSLLGKKGWTARRTKGSGDGGVDIVLTGKGKTVIVQCKAHGNAIGPGPVRELYGTFVHHKADEAWLVTTSGFSKAAQSFAKGKPIRLITIGEILRESQGNLH
jgi:restriction endonuclease Mrr